MNIKNLLFSVATVSSSLSTVTLGLIAPAIVTTTAITLCTGNIAQAGTVNSTQSTTIGGVDYAGTVLAVGANSANFHTLTFNQYYYDAASGTYKLGEDIKGGASENAGKVLYTNDGADTASFANNTLFYTMFASVNGTGGDGTYGNTLYYNGSGVTYNNNVSFNHMSLGGLIVDAAVTSVTIKGSNTTRNLYFTADAATGVNMSIASDTNFHNFGNIYIQESGTWDIASGKTLEFDTTGTSTMSISAGKELTLTGDGKMTATQNFTNAGTLNAGADLVLSGSITNTGTMNITGDLNFAQTITNTGTITLGTGGTLTVEETTGLQFAAVVADALSGSSVNGYGGANYYLAKGGTLTDLTGKTANVAGTDYTIGTNTDGAFVFIDTGKQYFVNEGTVTYDATDTTTNSAGLDDTTGVVLAAGATLDMLTALNTNATNGIIVAGTGTINLQDGVKLESSSITNSGTDKAKLTGEGNYNITGGKGLTAAGLTAAIKTTIDSSWTGTVTLDGVGTTASTVNNLNSLGNANSTVEFKGIEMALNQHTTEGSNANTINIKLTNTDGGAAAWSINTGYGGQTTTLSGKITGDGDIQRSESAGSAQTFNFTGDVSEWTGNFKAPTSSITNVKFQDSATEINAGVNLNNGTMTVNNANAVAVNGKIEGNTNVAYSGDGNKTVSGANSYTGTTTISAGTVTTTNNTALGTGAVSLTDATLAIGTGTTLTTGNLTLGATGKIELKDESTLTANNIAFAAGSTIDLWDITEAKDYVLATSTTGNITGIDDIVLTGNYEIAGYTTSLVQVGNDLVLRYTENVETLTGIEIIDYDNDSKLLTLKTDFTGTELAGLADLEVSQGFWSEVIDLVGAGEMVDIQLQDAEGKIIDLDQLMGITVNGGGDYTINATNNTFGLVSVPEPSSVTLSLLALAGLAARRRRA